MVNTFDDVLKIAESQAHSIPIVDDTINFWMVRSKKGIFYNEYIENEYIAIGWNVLTPNNLSNTDEQLKKLFDV